MKTIFFIFSLLALAACFYDHPRTQALPITDTKEDVADFIKGFLDGIGATNIYLKIQTCVKDSETFLIDVSTGIRDLQTKNPEKVKEGIRLLGQASKLITSTARECKTADAEVIRIIRMIRTFTNPVSFVYHAEKSLLINRIEVFKEVFNAIIAYENQDYEEVGYWVGKAMNSIFFKSSMSIDDTMSEVLDFVFGFLQGLGVTDVYSQIKGCIIDSEQFLIDLGVGIQDVQSQNAEKVREGIKILGQAAKMIPEAALACKVAESDVQRIINLIASFTNPTSFAYYVGKSILIDSVEIFYEISHAVIAYQQKDYKNLAYWIGQAMASIFLNSPNQFAFPSNSTEILYFVEGFLEGIGSSAAFEQVRECIDDSKTVISDLTNGVEDIKTKNAAKVKEGVQLIGQAVQIIPNAVELCKAGEVDVKVLIKMVETFKSPISFLYYVGKSLVINHVEVFDEVNSAVTAYDAKNYTQLGYWIGKTMYTILLGQDVISQKVLLVNDADESKWEVLILKKIEE